MALPQSLSQLVDQLKHVIETTGSLSPVKAKEIVLESKIELEDLMHYADFDHPTEDCYGRKLVCEGEHFEVMVMSWNPGDFSAIHNHGYTEWGVVQVFGDTHHIIYNLKNNNLSFAKKEILRSGSAIKVNNALIHQMGNITITPYLTLHVYGSNHLKEKITDDAKHYDLELDRVSCSGGGAFFNLPDHVISKISNGVKPTQAVFTHHMYLLMSYYNRQKQSQKIIQLKKNLIEKLESYIYQLSVADSIN